VNGIRRVHGNGKVGSRKCKVSRGKPRPKTPGWVTAFKRSTVLKPEKIDVSKEVTDK
jgi:hypothetical protein